VCPQCGSAAAVHSIGELAALARGQLGGVAGSGPAERGQGPGPGGPPQQGFDAEPQQGPLPGYAQEPRSGYLHGRGGGYQGPPPSSPSADFGDDLAGLAMGMAAQFIGRGIGRRMQRVVADRVMPAMVTKRDEMLRQQIAIAERHPDLCACLTDKVVFLAGGSRVLPMPNVTTVTVEESDALVAQLRNG
jgi:hypothetical protein